MVNATIPSQARPARTYNTGRPLDRFGSTLYGTLLGDEDDITSRDTTTRRPYVPTLRATRHDGTRLISPLTFQRSSELGRTRNSLWPEFPVPVAQMLNNESRTRIMVNRLNDLISQLCALRVRAVSLSETSAQISTSALQINLGGLDNSLILLDTAIKDLEDRVSSATRRLDRASGRSISDWVTLSREPIQTTGFTSSPSQSLISLARSNMPDRNPNIQLPSATAENTGNLPDRLGHFSESLANLNSRLDRVANNFRSMQEQETSEPTTLATSTRNSGTLSSWLADGNDGTATPGYESSESTTTIPTILPLPPISADQLPALLPLPEASSGEMTEPGQHDSFSGFISSSPFNPYRSGSHTVPAWSDGSFLDSLQSTIQRDGRHVQQSDSGNRTLQRDNAGSLRMRELDHETYTARSQDRLHQEELLRVEESRARRQPTTPELSTDNLQNQDEYEFPAPKLSSHVPLCQDQERIFVDGVEYRNCLGLWLSYTGEHAPEHALPSCQPDASSSE